MSTPPNRAKILIVDDSKLMRVTLKSTLSKEFTIVEANDGEPGWVAVLEDKEIQVVITDAQMPILDGYGLIERIRSSEDERVRQLPIMLVTAADEEEARERALQLGATDFITKPFDKTQLVARVRTHAKLSNTTESLAKTEAQLEAESAVDPLTGVGSKRFFYERVGQAVAQANRHRTPFTLLVLEMDHHQEWTQSLGKDAAKKQLIWTAQNIKGLIRADDTVARFTGPRFFILANGSGVSESLLLCERISKHFQGVTCEAAPPDQAITFSIGISGYGIDKAKSLDDLIRIAEQRLGQVQSKGGNSALGPAVKPQESPQLTVDLALRMIAAGTAQKIERYLVDLALKSLPLIETADRKYDLKLAPHIDAIRTKLGQVKAAMGTKASAEINDTPVQ